MKFTPEMNTEMHLGNMVKAAMLRFKVKQIDLATKLGRKESTVSRLIRQADWYVKDLVAASEVIGINLLKDVPVDIDTTGILMEPSEIYVAQTKDLARCEAELLEKKEIVAVYKKQVRLLEDKMRALEIELNRLRSAD